MAETVADIKECLGIRLYSIVEVANMLGVSERTAYQYIKDGKLRGQKIGTHWKVSEDNLRAFLNGEK